MPEVGLGFGHGVLLDHDGIDQFLQGVRIEAEAIDIERGRSARGFEGFDPDAHAVGGIQSDEHDDRKAILILAIGKVEKPGMRNEYSSFPEWGSETRRSLTSVNSMSPLGNL